MVEGPQGEIPQKNRLITILGPTASGKTSRAVAIANWINGDIISADSRQVYKDMDLGTGKDLEDYGNIPYHLINICEAGEKYNLHRYIKDFNEALIKIKEKDKFPILCGGSGLYLETALSGVFLPEVPENKELREKLKGLDLEELTKILKEYKRLHNITDVDTTQRAIRAIEIQVYYNEHKEEALAADRKKNRPIDSLIIGIDITREDRRRRISDRLHQRLEQGMVEEVRNLIEKGIPPEDLIYYGLEYKYLTLYITGELSYQQMERELEIAIHQFAKRQMTWFRGMERRGFKINWLPYNLSQSDFIEEIRKLFYSTQN